RIALIDGPSMTPTLHHGDRVLVRRIRPSALRRGDLVMVSLAGISAARGGERHRFVVKRVAALPGDPVPTAALPRSSDAPWFRRYRDGVVPPGMLVVLGDNPDFSVDSRDFGYLPVERLFGVVVRPVRRTSADSAH
ncbi:MAG TPA: signal peptidase I, partial [Micromonosporaceae bacterium]